MVHDLAESAHHERQADEQATNKGKISHYTHHVCLGSSARGCGRVRIEATKVRISEDCVFPTVAIVLTAFAALPVASVFDPPGAISLQRALGGVNLAERNSLTASSASDAALSLPTSATNPCGIPIHTSSRASTPDASASSSKRRESSNSTSLSPT